MGRGGSELGPTIVQCLRRVQVPLSSAVDLVPGRLEHVEVGVGSDSLERHQRRRAVAANVDYSRAFVDVSFLAGPWRSAKALKLEQPFYRALCRQ